MKISLVILLCMLQWFLCEASRTILIERVEAVDNGNLLTAPRTMLLEAIDEGNGMETDFMLPYESDNEKPESIVEEEKKRSKQQKYQVMEEEALQKNKLTNEEHGSGLSEIGDGDLLLEDSHEENLVGDNPMEKKDKYNTEDASTVDDSSALLTGEAWQEEGKKKVRLKKQKYVKDDMASSQLFGDNTLADEGKGEVAEAEASLMETAKVTDLGDFLSDAAEELDGNTDIKQKLQDDAKVKKKTEKAELKGTLKAKKQEKEGFKSKILGNETLPTDALERKIQVEDLVSSASKAGKGVGEKKRRKDDQHTAKYVNANESGGGENYEKPFKKFKAAKRPTLDVLEGADSEFKGSYVDEKKIKTKVKKKKKSQFELEKTLDVIGADSQSKQADMEDASKSQRKKKKVKSDKIKEEESSYAKDENFDVFEKEEEFSDKANKKSPKESTKKEKSTQKEEETSFKKVEKKEKRNSDDKMVEGYKSSKFDDGNGGEDTQDFKILEVIDHTIAEPVKDTSSGKGDAYEKHLSRSEDELSTIEKQEKKVEMEVQGAAKEAQEKTEVRNSVSKSMASLSEEVDEEDDEDSDFMQDFFDLSTKFQDTALKVADHLGPNIQKLTDTSKTYFNKANQQITESFSPLVGKQFAPFFASLLSYGLLLVPLAVVIIMFEHMRAMLSLQKVILFVNIYLTAYFATLLSATFIMGEPMAFFYKSSMSGYVHLQLLQAFVYTIYLILQSTDLVSSCTSEACSIKVTVVLQWFVAVAIGFHYYVTIFHRAMTLKGPHTNWKIYGIYSCAFLALSLFTRIKRVKKGYSQVGQGDAEKKH